MASGKKSTGGSSVQAARAAIVVNKPKPWGTIIAIVAVLALAGGVFGYAYVQLSDKKAHAAALAKFTPTDSHKDPSDQISGVVKNTYPAGKHVTGAQRVAYDQSPPFGGPHDEAWATCTGQVYPQAVRNENMVHTLEHGAVWIAYNPDKVRGSDLDRLTRRVTGQPFTMLSPYPGLDRPISLQSWGHQLKLDGADDERIDQFIQSLRQNRFTYPEVGSPCDALGPGRFDPDNPPPFNPAPPGTDAVPMTGGTDASQTEAGQANVPNPPAPPAATTTAPGAPNGG